MLYYINGQFIKSTEAKISFSDGGFLYGDGLFETMRFDDRNIFSAENHLNRLMRGLKVINFKINKTETELITLLNQVIDKNDIDSGIIRLMITRGNTDKQFGEINIPSLYISIKPFYEIPIDPVKVLYLKETDFPIIRFTPAIKSMNYIGNMLAKKYCDSKGAFEPVFYNDKNLITECAIRNIFYIKNNTLYTPSLDLGILSGVMRETIIEIAKSLNIKTFENHLKVNEIDAMDEAFISSTGIGLLPCFWDGWTSDFNLTKQIKKELFNRIKNS
tara:strand:- start:3061 stop:3882 length:822 start_codon:yes stop_codon:yes gene_type:complete